jgi:hypothetical protein
MVDHQFAACAQGNKHRHLSDLPPQFSTPL